MPAKAPSPRKPSWTQTNRAIYARIFTAANRTRGIGPAPKNGRLRQWCADANAASETEGGPRYGFVYVDEESFKRHKPKDFAALTAAFREYQQG